MTSFGSLYAITEIPPKRHPPSKPLLQIYLMILLKMCSDPFLYAGYQIRDLNDVFSILTFDINQG